MEEVWKDIDGYEGLYQVSNLGRVKSFDRYVKNKMSNKNIKKGRVLRPCVSKYGYLNVNLVKNTKGKTSAIHRLVAIAFIENPENKLCVNHIDGNKKNNNVYNLEWVTHSENNIHAIKTGLRKKMKGKNHYKRPVNQYTLNGKFIKRWESLKDVKDAWNLKSNHISDCCKGKTKTVLGYKWKYAN
ncbi:MAG: NUMOD4 domain-containing protein [Clostridia bacterium]